MCNLEWETDDEQYNYIQTIWSTAVVPNCTAFVTAVVRVFTPTFAASDDCPFDYDGLELDYGGASYSLANTDIACDILETNRSDVQNVMGWLYLMMSVVLFARLT